jgi:hypothetical protein
MTREGKRALLCVFVFLLGGCQDLSRSKPAADEAAFRKPSATEVFNLRSKCAELGEKIKRGNAIGVALAQEQASHYDAKSNRCYVELTTHMADQSHFDDHLGRYLYDGQTGEILAWIKIDMGDRSGWTPDVFGVGNFSGANKKIDDFMADDRK